jgi:putative transposase
MPLASLPMKSYPRGQHTVYHPRYHIVWITKYRYKVLTRPMKERIREIIAQVTAELGASIENGASVPI